MKSQSYLSEAVRLDESYRGAELELVSDLSAVDSGLVVSEAVDRNWTFSDSATDPTRGLSWALLAMAVLGLGVAIFRELALEGIATRLLDSDRRDAIRASRGWRRVNRFFDTRVAIVAAGAFAAWALLQSAPRTYTGAVASVLTGLALAWLFGTAARVRTVSPRPRRGYVPAVVAAGIGTAVGYAFIPVPAADGEVSSWRDRWLGPLAAATIAALGLGLALWSGTPFVRTLGLTALTMLSVALLPIRPFDGARIVRPRIAVMVSTGMLIITGAIVLGLF